MPITMRADLPRSSGTRTQCLRRAAGGVVSSVNREPERPAMLAMAPMLQAPRERKASPASVKANRTRWREGAETRSSDGWRARRIRRRWLAARTTCGTSCQPTTHRPLRIAGARTPSAPETNRKQRDVLNRLLDKRALVDSSAELRSRESPMRWKTSRMRGIGCSGYHGYRRPPRHDRERGRGLACKNGGGVETGCLGQSHPVAGRCVRGAARWTPGPSVRSACRRRFFSA